MSDKYISQEAIKNALVDKFKARIGSSHIPTWNDAFDAVTKLPTADVVEVVRCKDCIYWRGENDLCKGICIDFDADGYCSDGKRKDGGQDDV